jgi:hypothetical protein
MTIHMPGVSRIRARQISHSDVPAVAALLARGFPERSREFWRGVFARLEVHPIPAECPKYGYLLESGGAVVGAILLISSRYRGDPGTIRCNVSSWFVEPAFRSYASLLVSKALSLKHVTYLNITPAPQTIPLLRVQGYSQYSNGVFVAVPALQRDREDSRAKIVKADAGSPVWGEQFEHELLLEHARYGCLSLWCVTRGQAYPFVFRPRALKGVMPCAQLIYSRDIDDFIRLAGPLGRWLAARGRLLVVVDANGPVPGLIGKYLEARQPKFFKGPERPRLGDLVYTETAMFGI